jgi:hypothetical protein
LLTRATHHEELIAIMAIANELPVATKVKETVKETLLGSEEPAQLSAHTKATFMKHAHHDETAGELVMKKADFVDAIAPAEEDYVSHLFVDLAASSVG